MTDKQFDKLFESPVNSTYVKYFMKISKQEAENLIQELLNENKIKESKYANGYYERA